MLMTIPLNSLSFYGYIYCSFNNLFPIGDFEPPGDGRRKKLENFYLFAKKFSDMQSPKCRIHWKKILKIQ